MTRSSDLTAEYAKAVDRLLADPDAIRAMFACGINTVLWSLMHGRLGIEPLGITPNGKAFVQPVVAYEELVDLISWRPTDPTTWHLRLGHTVLLGAEQADRAAQFDEPLTMHATPLDWLRGFGEGATVIDWDCHLPFHLSARRMLVADQDLKVRLSRALAAPPVQFEIRLEAA